MMGLDEKAQAHIVERPKHLDISGARTEASKKVAWVAETLKIMDKTRALSYDHEEFKREFSANKYYFSYMKNQLKKFGVKKPKMALDNGKVYIWANDER